MLRGAAVHLNKTGIGTSGPGCDFGVGFLSGCLRVERGPGGPSLTILRQGAV